MAHPPYGAGPAGQPHQAPPTGTIELHVQGNILVSNLVPPTVTIDGHKIAGVHVHQSVPVPVPAGMRHIEAHSQWMRKYGQAALDVEVRPGEHVHVYYAPPLHQFTTGNLGTEKQPMKGKGCFIGLMAFLLLIIVFVVVMTIVTM